MRAICFFAVLALGACAARAENWPNWRGPEFNGSSPDTGLPETFSATENVLWVAPMPGRSGATPVIWGDRVFVSSADAKTKDLLAICLDRKDGKVLWQKTAAVGQDREYKPNNNMASPSPITDGKSVYFFYGTGDLVAYDCADGKALWARNIQQDHGQFAIMWGYGSSATLYKEKLFVPVLQCDRSYSRKDEPAKLDSFILAVDPKTGKDLWKKIRPTDAPGETRESYATLIPNEFEGRSELLLTGGDFLSSHNPETGEENWRFGDFNPSKRRDLRIVPSAVATQGIAFASPPKHQQSFFAVKTGGSGTVTGTHLAWKLGTEAAPDVCTPLVYKGMLYILVGEGGKGNLYCVDPKSGEKKWEGKLPGKATYWGSPTAADGRIYAINQAGDVTVASAGNEFKILSTVNMGDGTCYSSIAIAHSQLFIRTGSKLFCIGKK